MHLRRRHRRSLVARKSTADAEDYRTRRKAPACRVRRGRLAKPGCGGSKQRLRTPGGKEPETSPGGSVAAIGRCPDGTAEADRALGEIFREGRASTRVHYHAAVVCTPAGQ